MTDSETKTRLLWVISLLSFMTVVHLFALLYYNAMYRKKKLTDAGFPLP